MKRSILYAFMVIYVFACSQPMEITSRPNKHTATSGTLGSAKFNNELPEGTADTLSRKAQVKE